VVSTVKSYVGKSVTDKPDRLFLADSLKTNRVEEHQNPLFTSSDGLWNKPFRERTNLESSLFELKETAKTTNNTGILG